MKKIIKSFIGSAKNNPSPAHLILYVVLGTELFHFVNSLKLNLVMPTIANVLNESKVRSWRFSNGTICLHYGNFLWDSLSVVVFMSIIYVLWRFVVRKLVVK